MVTLAKVYRKSERLGLRLAFRLDVVERILPVNLGLTGPKQVEIGTVQDKDRFGHDKCAAPDGPGRASWANAPRRTRRAPLSAFPPFGQAKGARPLTIPARQQVAVQPFSRISPTFLVS